MHFGGKGGVVLAGDLLLGLFLAAAVIWVVLVFGGGETVGYAPLVLCGAFLISLTRTPFVQWGSFFVMWCEVKKGLLTGVIVLVGVLLALLVRHRLILVLLLVNGVVCHIDLVQGALNV